MKSCQVAIKRNDKGCVSVLYVHFEPAVTAKDKSNKCSNKQVCWQNHCHLTAVLMDAYPTTDFLLPFQNLYSAEFVLTESMKGLFRNIYIFICLFCLFFHLFLVFMLMVQKEILDFNLKRRLLVMSFLDFIKI